MLHTKLSNIFSQVMRTVSKMELVQCRAAKLEDLAEIQYKRKNEIVERKPKEVETER